MPPPRPAPTPRPIPVGVGVEARLHARLQVQPHDGLGDSVRDGRHPKDPHPLASRLGDLHGLHRRRDIAPRRQPIPQLVQVPLEVPLELLDRLLVHPGRALVGLDPLIRLPDHPFGDLKRLVLLPGFAHPAPPSHAGWPPSQPGQPAPFAPPALPGFPATTRRSALLPRIGTLPLAVSAARGSPSRRPRQHAASHIGARSSHVPHRRLNRARATFVPDTTWPISRHPPGSSQGNNWTLVSMSSLRLRHFNSGSLTFAFPVPT
jgi:hypothetical protein